MKNKKIFLTISLLSLFTVSGILVIVFNSNILSPPLSQDEIDDLQFNREEEKLARDTYLTLFATWNISVFESIARSEQTHMDAIGDLIDQYGLEDPITDDTNGHFNNSILTDLYSNLILQGTNSTIEALKVGAFIEEMDIKDLQDFISRTDKNNLIVTYENLMKGSRNHLRSFIKTLENYGGSYIPTILPEEEYNSIISTPSEKGTN